MDDIYNEIGGWSDRGLSPEGVKVAFGLAKNLQKMDEKSGHFDMVYSSPLKRCLETAGFISHELEIRFEELPYLKERNTYGLLSGVKKEIAKKEYKKMYKAFGEGKYIAGAEKYGDFVERVAVLLAFLRGENHKKIICVTHGHLITVVAEEFMGLNRTTIGNGCILGLEVDKKGKLKLIEKRGINFTKEKLKKREEARKFKN